MTKQYFWPLSMIIFGAIMSATMLGFLPVDVFWLWPILMLLVGLGALFVADRESWIEQVDTKKPVKKAGSRRR